MNFNNILSSESISPKSFYSYRDFGYSRWTNIEENNLENAIILYEDMFSFSIPKSDIENHPLLIEVNIDEKRLKSIGKNIYLCDYTIYLDPWNTKFIFFSEQDKSVALSLSESSLETKMLRLYKNRILSNTGLKNRESNIEKIEDTKFNKESVDLDVRINKIKGLLYGYYIGAFLSEDLNEVIKYSQWVNIQDIVSAIISSPDKKIYLSQKEQLDLCFKRLNEQREIYKDIYNILENSKENNREKTHLILSKIKLNKDTNEPLDVNTFCNKLHNSFQEEENPIIRNIREKIHKIEKNLNNNHTTLSPELSEIICIDNKLSLVKDLSVESHKIFKLWINDVLLNKKYNKNINVYKKELSDTLTFKTKEILKDKWEMSQERIFLNKLRKHLNGESFNVEWSNDILSSISAVLICGNDWNKLLNFMRQKNMTNYRLAFSFYGILSGFANLERYFTDLLHEQDSNYLQELYQEFYWQIHGKNINTKPKLAQENTSFTTSSSEAMICTSPSSINTVPNSTEPKTSEYIKSLLKKCKSAKNDEQKYEAHYNKFGQTKEFLQAVKSDTTLQNGRGAPKNVIKFIEQSLKPNKINKSKNRDSCDGELPLFTSEQSNNKSKLEFYKDLNAFQSISSSVLPNDENIQKFYEKEIKWIQDVHKNNGYHKGKGEKKEWINLSDHSNDAVIKHFEANAKNSKYNNIDKDLLSKVVNKLKEIYQ